MNFLIYTTKSRLRHRYCNDLIHIFNYYYFTQLVEIARQEHVCFEYDVTCWDFDQI